MDRRFPMVLILSTVFASCVAGLFYRLAASRSHRPAAIVTKPVVVAAADLPVGTVIRASDLKMVPMPANFLPRNSFAKPDDVESRAVMAKILQDEPILQERLAAPGGPSGLVPMIPAGQRAVGVRVNDVISVAGFVQPGMRVDVVLTGHPPGSQNSVCRTVLQNILVLSAGPILTAEPKGQAINAAVVTLSVSPEQAEILILASAEGKVQLVLRNSADSQTDRPKGTSLSSLYGMTTQSEPAPSPRPPSEKKIAPKPAPEPVRPAPAPVVTEVRQPRTIEVIRGSKKSFDAIDVELAPKKSPNATN